MTIQYFAYVGNDDSIRKLKSLDVNIELYKDFEHFKNDIMRLDAAIAFLDNQLEEDIYSVCQFLSSSFNNLSVVLLDTETELDLKQAIQSGADDVISNDATKEQLMKDLLSIEARLEKRLSNDKNEDSHVSMVRKGKVVTVCSTKGGVGKTTFAVNFAVASSKKNQKVVLVDLNLQFGDVALFLDSKPKKTIYDWVKESHLHSSEFINSYLTSYSDNIQFLAAPQRPEFAEVISGAHIKILIEVLQEKFDVIIFDTSNYMEETGLVALEHSNEIFMMSYLDLPTLKNGKLFLETLESLSLKGKIKLILNRDSKVKGLKSTVAEEVLGLPVFARIPNVEKLAVQSINIGKPLTLTHPRSKASKIMFSIAQKEESRKKATKRSRKTKPILTVEGNV